MPRAPARGSRAGGRVGPRAEIDPSGARAERRARAIEEPLDFRPRPEYPFVALEVRNPARRTHYLVLLPALPDRSGALCTCPDFARRGVGTCKHLEAAWLWLPEHERELADLPRSTFEGGPGIWAEIDRRLAALGTDRRPDELRIRGPGAALLSAP